MSNTKLPDTESFYQWREHDDTYCDSGGKGPKLFIPHERVKPFDYEYETPELARKGLDDWGLLGEAKRNNWVLVKITLEPVERL